MCEAFGRRLRDVIREGVKLPTDFFLVFFPFFFFFFFFFVYYFCLRISLLFFSFFDFLPSSSFSVRGESLQTTVCRLGDVGPERPWICYAVYVKSADEILEVLAPAVTAVEGVFSSPSGGAGLVLGGGLW